MCLCFGVNNGVPQIDINHGVFNRADSDGINEPPRGKPRGIRGGAVAQTQEFYPDYEHTF